MFDEKNRFIMENYSVKSTFASFLPGIAGELGIPSWCFYVNRGQAVCSFGVSDKEHSIMEFYPAHQSYQNVSTLGFRTFLKVDGTYYEPFRQDAQSKKMFIGMNELEIEEDCAEHELTTRVLYYTLPEEQVGALCRIVTLENHSSQTKTIELLDGMPAILPYGSTQSSMKAMGQTSKAWMQVEDVESRLPYYHVSASTGDVAEVTEVKEGNFYFAMDEDGALLPVIVDPDVVFSYNVALTEAVGFMEHSLDELLSAKQVCQNHLPTGFFGNTVTLDPGTSYTIYEIAGMVADKPLLHEFVSRVEGPGFFNRKRVRANQLADELCQVIQTESADTTFDAYCKQTYLDNVLRGGFPLQLGLPDMKQIFYLYSRKHGDIERDYNFFRMLPEFYSQGNANFRDVNQNRRSDNRFTPYVGETNIRIFYNLLQLDGYNPLSVEMASFTLKPDAASEVHKLIAKAVPEGCDKVLAVLSGPFTPGELTGCLTRQGITEEATVKSILNHVIARSVSDLNANFGEGYWADHWTYNLDLVENFLAIEPEQEESLLFGPKEYTYFESCAIVNPRSKRYQMRPQGVRQYNAIDTAKKAGVVHKQARTEYGKGSVYHSNLAEKMVMLLLTKFINLDPYGMGIEMEGGKPGWYDALNGMPGLFGSSMAETCEVKRLTTFLIELFARYQKNLTIPVEAATLLEAVKETLHDYQNHAISLFEYWDKINTAKEEYRERTAFGIDGTEEQFTTKELSILLKQWEAMLTEGIERALTYGKEKENLCPCYFSYELDQYEENDGTILPKHFSVHTMPDFLEGPVHYMKLSGQSISPAQMYQNVRKSALYDTKLNMYKVNARLTGESHEIGRARAFTPGWLENESIWLHMEYKYLLETLKSGLYEEYFADLHQMCIPFLSEEMYGRSPLENSSFLASSANPNPRLHGKGFVARLSGSTAEFVNLWQLMMFGKNPFILKHDELVFQPQPALPDYLIKDDLTLTSTLLGKIRVVYRLSEKKSLIPNHYEITSILVKDSAGHSTEYTGSCLVGAAAKAVRNSAIALWNEDTTSTDTIVEIELCIQ